MTRAELEERLQEDYGDPGLWALETSDINSDDLAAGYEHCIEKLAPALEEELIASGGL